MDSDKAWIALRKVDDAVSYLNQERTRMGAYQNRFEHSKTNADNASENLTYAESRIRDTNIAKIMVNYSKYSILTNAGTAILAQANSNNKKNIQEILQF